MTEINSFNGTCDVLDSLSRAWREMHTAYLVLCEVNEGTYKNWQAPLEFTQETSPELRRALEEMRGMMSKLCFAAAGKQPGAKAAEERAAMCAACSGCSNSPKIK